MLAPTDLPADLLDTLAEVARLTAAANGSWWIFGGAAMRLYGARDIVPADVDVLLAPDAAKAILIAEGIGQTSDGGSDRFRSQVYGTITKAPLPIDILGGFQVYHGADWRPVLLTSIERIILPFGTIQVPTLPELIAITRQLGRPKDFDRAQRLEALLPLA